MDKNLVKFERYNLVGLAIGIVIGALDSQFLRSQEVLFAAMSQTIISLILLVLILLVSRKKNTTAKWIWVAMLVIGLPFYIPALGEYFQKNIIIGILACFQVGLQLLGLYFLFFDDTNEGINN